VLDYEDTANKFTGEDWFINLISDDYVIENKKMIKDIWNRLRFKLKNKISRIEKWGH
jgi:hypothetical protein